MRGCGRQVDVNFTEPSGLHADAAGERFDLGELHITSHRAVWVDAAARPRPGNSFSLPLAAVLGVELRAAHLWSPQKLRLYIHVSAQDRPAEGPSAAVRSTQIKVVSSQQPELLQSLQHALHDKRWEQRAQGAAPGPEGGPLQQCLASKVDPEQLSQLRDMGFPEARARRALMATDSAGAPMCPGASRRPKSDEEGGVTCVHKAADKGALQCRC